jgi:homoserine dehydrogenase
MFMSSFGAAGFDIPGQLAPTNVVRAGADVRSVAIVGFGTVGKSVAKILSTRHAQTLRLTHIANRNVARKRVDWVSDDVLWTESFQEVLSWDADIIVELIGGLHPAKELVSGALRAGKSVVTANKQLIATYGDELLALARKHGPQLAFGASVAGGIPVLPALETGLCGDRITEIRGILNGTCNYILTQIESTGASFEQALAEAQSLGYAEADPTDDVEGYDARAKLAILARKALGCNVSPSSIPATSIRRITPLDFTYARRIGRTIRQLSRARWEANGITAWVQPALVPLSSATAKAEGSQNVVVTTGEFGGDTVFSGYGAGGDPTAVAVVSDLIAIARGATPASADEQIWDVAASDDFEAPRYVKFVINDRLGILASLATAFSKHGINIEAVLQEPGYPKTARPFVMTLEPCRTSQLRAAVQEIDSFDFLVEPALAMPIF